MPHCPTCASPLDDHDRHIRFTLPQPVLDLTDGNPLPPDTWLTHETPADSVMMQHPALGAFVRALLPINLAGGHTLTYGVWLAVNPADLPHILGTWWEPEYVSLRVNGWLANPIPPWGMLATPVQATVRDPDHTPYCDNSTDPQLTDVLTNEWPHEVVLGDT